MKCVMFFAGILCVVLACSSACADTIDREALVSRHDIRWEQADGVVPLGNGEFCFNADATGLQTFGGNIMAHWAWHSFPMPEGWTPDRFPATGTFQKGRNAGPDVFPEDVKDLRQWLFDNPHAMNLGRIRFCGNKGHEIVSDEISAIVREMNLWSGVQSTVFKYKGEPVRVETCVHPELDAVAIRVESPLIARSDLGIELAFPYPAIKDAPWVGDFSREDGHTTEKVAADEFRALLVRKADAASYYVGLRWSRGASFLSGKTPHQYRLFAKGDSSLQLVCAFSSAAPAKSLPTFAECREKSVARWREFWASGGAIDLSASKDPRWRELERRIVLSQYLMAAQSAGSYPSAESGLMKMDPWRNQFHMEMTWWHLAHYALWDRWAMADEALTCYKRFAPSAAALAAQLGYKGLQWPKSVGPEGRSAPWTGNQVLLWKQPHPMFFAELEYRLKPVRETLEKWSDIIQGTAEFMTDYVIRDEQTGICSLNPVMPPSEQGITKNTVFDLAYWRWGLDKAQEWRERMGLPREPLWDDVRRNLAPLPVVDGVFVHSAEWHDTYTKRAWEHPDPVGVLGMLPPIDGVDAEVAQRTVLKVWKTWDWNKCWGWDFPWMAMAAARAGEPQLAVDALLKDAGDKNTYDMRGLNGGWYLPGNGGLLYAVAMMAAGWDGAPEQNAPGFPADGSWTVKWEGLKKAP